jgi:hypothetical protein
MHSEKQLCLNDINSGVMPRLGENHRLRVIGMLQAGLAQTVLPVPLQTEISRNEDKIIRSNKIKHSVITKYIDRFLYHPIFTPRVKTDCTL